ncbi:DUF1700 domain-containing protein [Macrococcus hajekii]|uniref:DUF1700 domain-containing protein n=1 Tax=Macrococcus hajekii TaxID=198482 RepID=A0A4R6BLX4_9STAP|nr:DUF1700 domain-containing protein [Macrococcus hajekii]TDM02796.1 DUF1700 domain-containing protein [Macrococcus hajekii]GGB03960.1 hypothetical protein GCM10007190_10000 [Macrococcus hajekii]
MNRKEFLNTLYQSLDGLSPEEKHSIMLDYEEYFEDGIVDGKSEQQISAELGLPSRLAKEHKATYTYERAQHHPTTSNVFQAVVATVGLSVLNFFVISVPFLIYISMVVSMAFMTLMFIASPLFLGLDYIVNGATAVSWFEGFVVILLAGVGLMMIVILYYIIKFGNKILMKYINWNINTVKGVTQR